MRLLATALFAAGLMATPALAGEPVTLKADTHASGAVTLGDLFDGAGPAAEIVVAPAIKPGGALVLDAGLVRQAAANAGLTWINARDIGKVVVRGDAQGRTANTPVAARAASPIQVLAYAHNIETGEIIQADDLTWSKEAVSSPAGAPRDADQLIGKQARRPLREGAAASTRDVSGAIIIKKDDLVTVHFDEGGVSLTMQGKAMGQASVGDAVSVMNTSTKKVIQTIASGPDQAVIGPEAERIRAQALAPSSSQTFLR
jgi:flagella basal body P-ring formation protein FlgA